MRLEVGKTYNVTMTYSPQYETNSEDFTENPEILEFQATEKSDHIEPGDIIRYVNASDSPENDSIILVRSDSSAVLLKTDSTSWFGQVASVGDVVTIVLKNMNKSPLRDRWKRVSL